MLQWAYADREFHTEAEAVEQSIWAKLDKLDADQIIRRRAEVIEWLLDIDRAANRDKARQAASMMKGI